MDMKRVCFGLGLVAGFFFSCGHQPDADSAVGTAPKNDGPALDEKLALANQGLIEKDLEAIGSYAERRGWNMQTTERNFYYEIYAGQELEGPVAQTGDTVTIAYRLALLDGTLCYTSDSLGLLQFVIGAGKVEMGLEYGISLMREGQKARFIVPPHLAHGLLGDRKCIPPRAILVYDVELLALNREFFESEE